MREGVESGVRKRARLSLVYLGAARRTPTGDVASAPLSCHLCLGKSSICIFLERGKKQLNQNEHGQDIQKIESVAYLGTDHLWSCHDDVSTLFLYWSTFWSSRGCACRPCAERMVDQTYIWHISPRACVLVVLFSLLLFSRSCRPERGRRREGQAVLIDGGIEGA